MDILFRELLLWHGVRFKSLAEIGHADYRHNNGAKHHGQRKGIEYDEGFGHIVKGRQLPAQIDRSTHIGNLPMCLVMLSTREASVGSERTTTAAVPAFFSNMAQ